MPAPRIVSDDESSTRGGSPPPRDLFSDDDAGRDSEDDGGRGHESQAEEDDGGDRPSGGGRPQGTTEDKNTDDEEEEDRKREERRKKEEEKKKKPKGPVRRQMISEDMLTGAKGVSKLPEIFQDFQFKGKGKEKEDLSNILSKLEHWVHLLHPKQPFDQSLQRIEFLGHKKKIVKTHLKKLRMGLLNNYDERDEIIEDEDGLDVDVAGMEAEASENQREEERARAGASQQPAPGASTSSMAANDDFPDDDELFEMMNDAGLTAGKENALPSTQREPDFDSDEDMDIDMDDVGGDDDYLQKQLEVQLKRAAEAEARANEASEMLESQNNLRNDKDAEQPSSLTPAGPEASTILIPTPAQSDAANITSENNEDTILIQSGEEVEKVALVVSPKSSVLEMETDKAAEGTTEMEDDDDGICFDDLRDD